VPLIILKYHTNEQQLFCISTSSRLVYKTNHLVNNCVHVVTTATAPVMGVRRQSLLQWSYVRVFDLYNCVQYVALRGTHVELHEA
jgi:hypothetical protein